jgi:iron(II)-dependent oxidoreductase
MQRLRVTRERTLSYAADLTGAQLLGPRLAIVNPPLWEIAHVGWFQEYWCLRYRDQNDVAPSLIATGDALYDSARVPHATRWTLPLLPFDAVLRFLDDVLTRVLERLQCEPGNPALRYFAELAAAHEEMHGEAFTYTRQTHGYAAPRGEIRSVQDGSALPGDVALPGGEYWLGARRGDHFVFDNEKWEHAVALAPFQISRAAVTNREFAEFVDDDGYARRELWCDEGWQWRCGANAQAPAYWIKETGGWRHRVYDKVAALSPHSAVIHVNWYEADAWCRWAGRRLPSEAEWEQAAATSSLDAHGSDDKRVYPWGGNAADSAHANLYGALGAVAPVAAFAAGDSAWGCRQMLGNVWEWTADWFNAYPGFERDPYQEYSEPWFGNHKVLRGGCFATTTALLRTTWRNFYTPDRRDVFAGFRTCAV